MRSTTVAGIASDKGQVSSRVLTALEAVNMWPELEVLLSRSFKGEMDEYSIEDVLHYLSQDRMTAFVMERDGAVELVCIVGMTIYANFRVADILFVAGKGLKEAVYFFPALEAWAMAMNARELRTWCSDPAVLRLCRMLKLPFRQRYTVISENLRGKLN